MSSPPRVRRRVVNNNEGPPVRLPPAIRRNQREWDEIFPREVAARGGPPGGSPGRNNTRSAARSPRGGKRKTRKGRKSRRRRRPHRGGSMYPNDENTVIVDREDDSPDSVMRVRSYNVEMDNANASQNSSV